METSNREPRRFWKSSERHRSRVPCASCGAPAHPDSSDVSFCMACLDRARQGNLAEWDELGIGD
jgi:hypothetical protein